MQWRQVTHVILLISRGDTCHALNIYMTTILFSYLTDPPYLLYFRIFRFYNVKSCLISYGNYILYFYKINVLFDLKSYSSTHIIKKKKLRNKLIASHVSIPIYSTNLLHMNRVILNIFLSGIFLWKHWFIMIHAYNFFFFF